MSARMIMNWEFILYVRLTKACPIQWVRSKNGNQWQTMYDGVRNTCRFLDSEQKILIGEVCLQASDCFKSKSKDIHG